MPDHAESGTTGDTVEASATMKAFDLEGRNFRFE